MKNTFDLLDINSIRPFIKLVLKYKKAGSVLDLGSGVGRHSLFLAKKGFKVTAVDNKSELMAALKALARLQKLPINIIKDDVTTYLPKKKFDVLISTMVLHFIPPKTQAKMIATMQNHTTKNGLNVLSSYTDKNKKGLRPHPLKPGNLKSLYEKAGWTILHYTEGLGQPNIDASNKNKTVSFYKEEIIAQKTS